MAKLPIAATRHITSVGRSASLDHMTKAIDDAASNKSVFDELLIYEGYCDGPHPRGLYALQRYSDVGMELIKAIKGSQVPFSRLNTSTN